MPSLRGIIGFSYGSLVPGHEDGISYTEVEFRGATTTGLPQLVFLLDQDAALPPRLVDVDRRPVEGLRQRLRDAGVIVKTFTDAGDLGEAVLHALGELQKQHEAAGDGPGGVISPTLRPGTVSVSAGPVVGSGELPADVAEQSYLAGPARSAEDSMRLDRSASLSMRESLCSAS